MSQTSGISEQILSLPRGGGAVRGLGESFQPDLHNGTGAYAIPLDIPNGPNDIAPQLTLLYSTGVGNGPFGMGFSLNLFTISRSTNKRTPTYQADDPLVLLGGGELVDLGGGDYRLRVDSNGWRIRREGNGFAITDHDGRIHRLGVTEQAQTFVEEGGIRRVLAWHLEETQDALGNSVQFTYQRAGNQLYLETVRYSIYTLHFTYTARPDPLLDGRAGILITTGLRCDRIELHTDDGLPHALTRRWDLAYRQAGPGGGHSLLHQVTLTGFDADGNSATLPTLTLGYTNFAPRQLSRFQGDNPGAALSGRRELVDWDGDGLPDLLELGGGRARIWPNLGNFVWGHPQSLPTLPAPIALDEPGVAFADMEGNGTADLVMLDRPLNGYYPLQPGGGFDRPVFWRHGPGARLNDPNARLVDLNADGITDLLVTGDQFFTLYERAPEGGWQTRPQTIARPQAPPVSLRDPRVFLADMNGDGLQDLVRVNGANVRYWPYLGNGRWAAPVTLQNTPTLPRNFDPQRLRLSDIDGDGCADLVYVDNTSVTYWLNQGGTRLSEPQMIDYTPRANPGEFRLADMNGGGTAGVLWSYSGPERRMTDFFYLDFTGGIKPYLLNRIDNGMGLVTEISYGTSSAEAIRDRQTGAPWSTFLPFALPVVTAITQRDVTTGRPAVSHYRYHNGHFDGISREFGGFALVEIEELGDEHAPTLRTRNYYHIGLDPTDPARPLGTKERQRLQVLRGKLLKTEVFGLDGSPDEVQPYMRTEHRWVVDLVANVGDIEIVAPRQLESTSSAFERQADPFRVTKTRNLAFDEHGNITDQEQRAVDPRDAALTRTLRTTTTFAHDATGRFRNKSARTVQRDGDGNVVAATISYYDDLPEGEVGATGLLTGQESLVLPDGLVGTVYGVAPPDLAALGYHRRAGEDGWWINQLRYTRTDDAAGLRGTATNARGETTAIAYDDHKIHPVHLRDALGNTVQATFDYRANKLRCLTDANGATMTNHYDPLGRLERTVEPNATAALPTTRHRYLTDNLPVRVVTEQRAVDGRAQVIERSVTLDGHGQVLEERVVGDGGAVVERSQTFAARGMLATQFLPFAAPGPAYAPPDVALSHTKFHYDAIGRLIAIHNADGTVKEQRFTPGVALLYDEEDTRSDGGALHADTPTLNTYDSTGRVMKVTVENDGALHTTDYNYDVKGNLRAVTEANGLASTFNYDLLGHRLQAATPATGVTTFLFDPNGNMVEKSDARNETVTYQYDALDRLVQVSIPATGDVVTAYSYHDTGQPAPPEAGAFTVGRIVKVVHQGGTETYDYDPMGRLAQKRIASAGLPGGEIRFDYSYRADGQRHTITYPEPAPGAGRRQINYEYNRRGQLIRIPNIVRRIDYNLAGVRTRVEQANNVVTAYGYDPAMLRLIDLTVTDSSGNVLQVCQYHYDQTGNLLRVESPDSKLAATYAYDDLDRLTQATRAAGEVWNYSYDGVGNLTHKSDVGAFSYDANGLLIGAGADHFTYTAAGQTETALWGATTYDALGRLQSITRGSEALHCVYDHDGRRVRTTLVGGAVPDELLTPDEMITVNNGVVFASIFDGPARVAQIRLSDGAISFLHGDHLGSTSLVTDQAEQVIQRIYYDPFGAMLENNVAAGATGTDHLYAGAHWEEWSGLIDMHARAYDPRIGRFITPDTLVPDLYTPMAWNRYSYVLNNPLRFTDPTGHFWKEIGEWFEKSWKYIVAAVAIVAVVVLTIVTFGAAALIAVGIGMVIGGVVGGIAAYQAGGDVLLGVLVGMAVGGAAAFAGAGIGAGIAALIGNGLAATLIAGTLSGAVGGAAMGFTAGFAGGAGNAQTIFDRMWRGALVGAITGLAFSFVYYGFANLGWAEPKISVGVPKGSEVGAAATRAGAQTAKEIGQQANAGALTAESAATSGLTNAGKETFSLFVHIGTESGFPLITGLAPVWQPLLTFGTSGVFVLDWADDLWRYAVGKGLVKYEYKGKF